VRHQLKSTTISGLTSTRLVTGPRAPLETVAEGGEGLLLRLRRRSDGSLAYDIVLLFAEAVGERLLMAEAEESAVVAAWRRIAADLGQRLLIETTEGLVIEPARQMGRVLLGDLHDRRRCSAMTKRRPHFLRRRKTGRLPARPVVVRGVELVPCR
jgi:hypothetical protein